MKILSKIFFFWALVLGTSTTSLLAISATSLAQEIPSTCLGDGRELNAATKYDVIVFGDEVPGVMAALKVKRELAKSDPSARVAMITEGNIARGVGGHLVRGGIAGLKDQVSPERLKNIHQDSKPTFNYGFRHTLPLERANLAVLGPASGFGGLGKSAGRIVELNVSVGEGLAIAVAMAITQKRSLHSISNLEVRQAMGYTPVIYGRKADNWYDVFVVEKVLRGVVQP